MVLVWGKAIGYLFGIYYWILQWESTFLDLMDVHGIQKTARLNRHVDHGPGLNSPC